LALIGALNHVEICDKLLPFETRPTQTTRRRLMAKPRPNFASTSCKHYWRAKCPRHFFTPHL